MISTLACAQLGMVGFFARRSVQYAGCKYAETCSAPHHPYSAHSPNLAVSSAASAALPRCLSRPRRLL